jgi:hypothetical protein
VLDPPTSHTFSLRLSLSSGGSVGNIDSAVVGSSLLSGLDIGALGQDALINIPNSESKASRVDVAMAEEEKRTKDRLRDKIKDAVEDSLRVRRDDVAALADTPGDWVEDPDDGCQATTRDKDLTNILTDMVGVFAGFPGELINDIDKCDAT